MDSIPLVQHNLEGQSFGYSGADLGGLEEKGSSEYTLVTIAVDASGSVMGFKDKIETCIQEVVKSCKYNPRADYLLIRVISFNSNMNEIHGFKQLIDCDPDDYKDIINPCGGTALFETVVNVINSTKNYGEKMYDKDIDTNAIFVILTDGMDSGYGHLSPSFVGDALKEVVKGEKIESIMSILVGVGVGEGGYTGVSDLLEDFHKKAGMDQYVEMENADEETFTKITGFISESVSSQSASLGTGGASQPLTF